MIRAQALNGQIGEFEEIGDGLRDESDATKEDWMCPGLLRP